MVVMAPLTRTVDDGDNTVANNEYAMAMTMSIMMILLVEAVTAAIVLLATCIF